MGELNLLTSTIEAEQTLNELVESRKVLAARQAKLQAKLDNAGDNSAFAQALMSEIANVGGDLDVRTEQIVELKQKIAAADLETKAKTRLDYLQTMIEAKVFYRFFHSIQSKDLANLSSFRNILISPLNFGKFIGA